MSNVGVRVQREQDSSSEGMEVVEAEGHPLEGFNGVVAALGKAVGQVNVECVEYVGFPVEEHVSAFVELRQFQAIAGIQPAFQAF